MNKKDNETERLEAEQSLYEHYWFDWYYGGRDRNAMIRWLKGNPQHGPVAFSCRPKCSFRPLSVRRRQGFSSPKMSVAVADCRSH